MDICSLVINNGFGFRTNRNQLFLMAQNHLFPNLKNRTEKRGEGVCLERNSLVGRVWKSNHSISQDSSSRHIRLQPLHLQQKNQLSRHSMSVSSIFTSIQSTAGKVMGNDFFQLCKCSILNCHFDCVPFPKVWVSGKKCTTKYKRANGVTIVGFVFISPKETKSKQRNN